MFCILLPYLRANCTLPVSFFFSFSFNRFQPC